jgi:hypothetical protein
VAGHVHIISFDRTLEALRFSMQHAEQLQFPQGFESQLERLVEPGPRRVRARLEPNHLDASRGRLSGVAASDEALPVPNAVFFDAFSPARNPSMWTLPLFESLFPSARSGWLFAGHLFPKHPGADGAAAGGILCRAGNRLRARKKRPWLRTDWIGGQAS